LNYFKPNFDSTRFLFIKIYNSKSIDMPAARYFERNLEIPIDTLNKYHSNKITIEEVLNIERFFEDLNKNLPFCSLMLELANKEPPFECFLDYGGVFSSNPFSKTECALNFYLAKYQIKLSLEFRNIVCDNNKNKLAIYIPQKNDWKLMFDFSKVLEQTPKLYERNMEFGDNLIIFEYDGLEKLTENLLAVLKFIKIRIFNSFLKNKIDMAKKPEFRVEEPVDVKKLKIKIDKIDVFINFSQKTELNGFIGILKSYLDFFRYYFNNF